MGKYLTIVLITEKTSKVKKFRIPLNILFFLSVLIIGALSFTGYVFHYYYTDSWKILQIDELRDSHKNKESKIESYYDRLTHLALGFDRLNETREKMRNITGLELADKPKKVKAKEKILLKKYKRLEEKSVLNIIDDADMERVIVLNNKSNYFNKLLEYEDVNKTSPPYLYPEGIPVPGLILAGFQYETDPFSSHEHLIQGITVGVRADDTKIPASADGIVINVSDESALGKSVLVYHNGTYQTKYSLLKNISVNVGDIIKKGYPVGTVSAKGQFSIPHYHYQVLLYNIPQNPNRFSRQNAYGTTDFLAN